MARLHCFLEIWSSMSSIIVSYLLLGEYVLSLFGVGRRSRGQLVMSHVPLLVVNGCRLVIFKRGTYTQLPTYGPKVRV